MSTHDGRTVLNVNGQTYFVDLQPTPPHVVSRQTYGTSLVDYNHPSLESLAEYKYDDLRDELNNVRLVRLHAGEANEPIRCDLIEVKYSGEHSPVRVQSGRSHDYTDGSKKEVFHYEALSWCWGTNQPNMGIKVSGENGRISKLRVTRELALALRHLRREGEPRVLWIDAICINQRNYGERSRQVQMMSLIYSRAARVCVWLGESDAASDEAFRFVRDKIVDLKDFDLVIGDAANAESWHSLLMLMQRPWFSRRWVVQEITMARRAVVYCGNEHLEWTDFALAVELFVEFETTTHGLSRIMQQHPKLRHGPGWFEHVAQVGASILVQTAATVFRSTADTSLVTSAGPARGPHRRALLSLEHLVTSMTTFKATEPRDAVYSLLAIAKDTAPYTGEAASASNDFIESLHSRPYIVDYARDYADVCKDFVSFCIAQSCKADPSRALDILCRPWALPPVQRKPTAPGSQSPSSTGANASGQRKRKRAVDGADGWRQRGYKRVRHNESFRELWRPLQQDVDLRTAEQYWEHSEVVARDSMEHAARMDEMRTYFPRYRQSKQHNVGDHHPVARATSSCQQALQGGSLDSPQETTGFMGNKLPSWVASIEQAPFALFSHPGTGHIDKIGRQYADPLVGLPHDGERRYNAAASRQPNRKTLRFRKRPVAGHYSLYVDGFVLDEVCQVSPHSQNGQIDLSWTSIGLWDRAHDPDGPAPPDDFWRTLVADQGKSGRNMPYHYPRACKETFVRGGLQGGAVNTTALINTEQNSIIADFCRRVQAVIWNRYLIRTKKQALGIADQKVLAGDLVCIIYGCTVPVILRRVKKKPGESRKERYEDHVEAFKSVMRRFEQNYIRKYEKCKAWTDNDSSRSCIPPAVRVPGVEPESHPDLYLKEIKAETEAINEKIKEWKQNQHEDKQRDAKRKKWKEKDTRRRREQVQERIRRYRRGIEQLKGRQQREIEGDQREWEREERYHGRISSGAPSLIKIERNPEEHIINIPPRSEPGLSSNQAPVIALSDAGDGEDEEAQDAASHVQFRRSGCLNREDMEETDSETDKQRPPLKGQGDKGKWEAGLRRFKKFLEDKYGDENDEYYYEFVGESYIHGMMDGEAVKEQFRHKSKGLSTGAQSRDEELYKERVFELR